MDSVVPVQQMKAYSGSRAVQPHSFLIMPIDGNERLNSWADSFTAGERQCKLQYGSKCYPEVSNH
jgi:hypothetical protein